MNRREITKELMDRMFKDRLVRTKITKQSHWYFFHFYFAHYATYKTAKFHEEIFKLTENEDLGNFFIVAFRGCGKSTILTTSFPIWAILGNQNKKFVLIACQTQSQAKQHMMNLRRELENNPLLKNDLGPFKEESDEWGSTSLVFSRSNARITAVSSEQSIRGLRHNQHRPDLIICDDVEDIASTKTRESRNKTYDWLTSEVIPTGDKNTRLVIVGNLLHEDSLLMRIKEKIEKEEMEGIFKEYPLINKEGVVLWEDKYPAPEDIKKERLKAGNDYSWKREYLLQIVPDEDQVIHRNWIQYYDDIPKASKIWSGYTSYREIRIGVDLAISKKETADYTVLVPALISEKGDGNYVIYILPKIINKRMSFPETVQMCKVYDRYYREEYKEYGPPAFVIEDVAYQKALPQQLISEGIRNVKASRPGNSDKRSRLILTSNLIKSGVIKFPKTGAEELINQIVHFGVEKHDDLVDGFSTLVNDVISDSPNPPRIYFL